jgi:hypothetical protein
MIASSSLKPGRIYTFKYNAPVDMVQNRFIDGVKQPNPLYGQDVTVSRNVTAQAAGKQTYDRLMVRLHGDNWQKSDRKDWASVSPENDCIMVHDKTQERYLRAIPRGIPSETYFIDGIPATADKVETIRAFKSGGKKDAPAYVRFKLDNIENLHDDGDDDEPLA